MTLPRSVQIQPEATPYYHCVSRCVRRAYLCGQDSVTGYNFEHRRAWIEKRLRFLAQVFAIDLCAYAVMSNHYHVVLHINMNRLRRWSDAEVVERWQRLHRLPDGFSLTDSVRATQLIAMWRDRLGSISWYMKSLNEPLARIANKEDGCRGRFWEGRFRSQALLDERAVVQCMAYVDLNPVRSGTARTPESSSHTSIKARVEGRDHSLARMADRCGTGFALPIEHKDYLKLVDHTGRALRLGKRGRISNRLRPILERLGVSPHQEWLGEMSNLTRRYCRAIGSATALRQYRDFLGQQRLNGVAG